jgi:hypothetical protein
VGDGVGRRVGAGLLAWLGGIVVLVAAAHPEGCPTVTAEEARAAAQAGVDWIVRTQEPDGEFLYRYDRSTGEPDTTLGYNHVRHAGTILALEQAAAAGLDGAESAAASATDWALDRLTELDDDRLAFTDATGGTGLLVNGLVEHRRATGDESHDDELLAMGRFLQDTVTDQGAITAGWDLDADEPVEGSRSPFFTGEILWALARLHAEFPGEGFDGSALKVSAYLATERDDVERRFPPVSDHWGAYAWDEIAAWPQTLTDEELDYVKRQAGLFSLQVRYESQRRADPPVRWTRGPMAVPAGVGTLGEGLGGIRRLALQTDDLDVDLDAVDERLACVAGMLTERQVRNDDPAEDGAWFRGDDVTQIDDQQHAISALLAAIPVLED